MSATRARTLLRAAHAKAWRGYRIAWAAVDDGSNGARNTLEAAREMLDRTDNAMRAVGLHREIDAFWVPEKNIFPPATDARSA